MFGQNRNISLCQYGRSFVRSLYLFDIEVVIPTTFHTTPPPPFPPIPVPFLPVVYLLLTPAVADK